MLRWGCRGATGAGEAPRGDRGIPRLEGNRGLHPQIKPEKINLAISDEELEARPVVGASRGSLL